MAKTTVQVEVAEWVSRELLPQRFGQSFQKRKLRLTSGGVFEFDAVSEDGEVICAISTSDYRTASGKAGSGKMTKIRSDMYFLLLSSSARRVMVFTEGAMFKQWEKQRENGRVPGLIEFIHAEIPLLLNECLQRARGVASREVSP